MCSNNTHIHELKSRLGTEIIASMIDGLACSTTKNALFVSVVCVRRRYFRNPCRVTFLVWKIMCLSYQRAKKNLKKQFGFPIATIVFLCPIRPCLFGFDGAQ